MNQLIEKFARESGAWDQVYGHRTFMIDEHFDIEKFARLIVKECMYNLYLNGYDDAMNQIRQHFGVEE